MKYEDWFDSDETLLNISKVIHRVLITEKVVMSMRMVEEMEVDEEAEEDVEMGLDVHEIPSTIVEEGMFFFFLLALFYLKFLFM